ncbi:hypothetical protein BJY01DRAFT_225090 [Aspergillus pseudoustus]|uniref:Uncharacterized protein n=1 Tax=Aspergillus pseudoustus TaxID=1810923 RepID=A0ABR4J0J2_9EURO
MYRFALHCIYRWLGYGRQVLFEFVGMFLTRRDLWGWVSSFLCSGAMYLVCQSWIESMQSVLSLHWICCAFL